MSDSNSNRIATENLVNSEPYSNNTDIEVDIPEEDKLKPAYLVAKQFLEALAPTGIITFQTLVQNESVKNKMSSGFARMNKIIHGTFLDNATYLGLQNGKGAEVFVMVNQGNGKGRKVENVLSIRALFVDLDGSPLDPVLKAKIPPSITVESSSGRYHAYWLVRDMPIDEFKPAQQALAKMFDGDPAVCDPPRLMRLPGYYHRKTDTPFLSRLLTCEPELVWDWTTLADTLGLPRSIGLQDKIPEGHRNNTLFKLAVAACKSGVPLDQRLKGMLTLNTNRCTPPLPEAEVVSLVNRAYKQAPEGSLMVPLNLLSDVRFVKLSPGPKLLLMLSYQRLVSKKNGDIALLWGEFKLHFPRENTFVKYRKQLVNENLLRITRAATKPHDGIKPQPALYELMVTGGG